MGKTKTSKGRKKSPKKSMVDNGVPLIRHDPAAIFKSDRNIKAALAEALLDEDKKAFGEILSGYVRALKRSHR